LIVDGDPLSLRVFADIINLQGYKKVILFDPHSDVAAAVINNSVAINNYSFVGDILVGKKNYTTASTDAGGYKKIFPLVLHLERRMGGLNDIIICDKVRDQKTGKVISTTVNVTDAKGQDIYLIDDIVDGGYTFEMIGEEMLTRNTGDMYLIASHWIGSKGEEGLKKYFKRIYTTNSVKDVTSDFVIQTNMRDIIAANLQRINL
jgi:ribose-phosphate pyrophosphokinase